MLDVDGTLLDSVYQHTVAWTRAFRGAGHPVESWRVHRHIGMGGDRLVAAVAGEEVEEASGDEIRATWKREYDGLVGEVAPLDGARDLLVALRDRGLKVALASSSIPQHAERAFDLLDAVWDVVAAARAGIPTLGVCSGGMSRGELLDAGAVEVYLGPADLTAHLDIGVAVAFGERTR